MDSTALQVQDGMVVNLAYVLTVESEQAGSTERKPTSREFIQGRKQVVPGLEQALYGMSVGEEKDVVVNATNGYGEVDPSAVKTLPRKSLPATSKAQPGEKVRVLHKRSGEMQKATVVEVQPDTIVLDFNHPFAGKTLRYHVRVDAVRPATDAELEASKAKRKSA